MAESLDRLVQPFAEMKTGHEIGRSGLNRGIAHPEQLPREPQEFHGASLS